MVCSKLFIGGEYSNVEVYLILLLFHQGEGLSAYSYLHQSITSCFLSSKVFTINLFILYALCKIRYFFYVFKSNKFITYICKR